MYYPARKEELIKQARNNNASQEVMNVLENLPDKEYENAVDVSKEFKGEGGSGGGQEHGGRGGSWGSQGSHGGGRGSHQESRISHRSAGSPPIEAQKALKGMDYPASKQEIIQHAKKHDADEEVMRVLEDIPDRQYDNAVDVSKEFKGETKEEVRGERGSHGQGRRGGEEEGGREGSRGGQGSHGGRGQNR